MNIAIIGPKGVLQSQKAGGIEARAFEIGRRLVEMGHFVTVYARRRHMPGEPAYVEGMRIKYLPTLYSKNLEAITHTLLATIHAIFSNYDIYDYHGVGPSTLAWVPRILRPRRRTFVTFHARDQFHQKWSWFGRMYLRFGEWASVHFPHYCITVSHTLQVLCRDHYHVQTIYIPNGAHAQFIASTKELSALGLKPKEYILTVGRLLHVKGIHHAIKAFRDVDTDKELVIVGEGTSAYMTELQELARGDHRIRFLGFQSGDPLRELFAHAYLFVQPSESEGLPLTVLESMSFGTATLVSNIEGNLEAIYHTGFVFENKNVDDLRKQLEHALQKPEEVIMQGEEGRAVIETKFSWDIIARHIESLYITSYH